jgi:hypothetical protein
MAHPEKIRSPHGFAPNDHFKYRIYTAAQMIIE